ncbi:hypothetical protein GCM10010264_60950 [Streptomyces globisporus]|nr:hypothetical protein GCM10010264_60950 [Streptomyces globisporus]
MGLWSGAQGWVAGVAAEAAGATVTRTAARAAGTVRSFVKRSMRDRAAHSFGGAHRAPERPGGPTWGGATAKPHWSGPVKAATGQENPWGPGCGSFRSGPGPHGRSTAYRNELISIVSVRPGPTPIAEIGAPDISSRAFT